MVNWMTLSPELFYGLVMTAVFMVLCLLPANPRRDHATALILAAVGLAVTGGAMGMRGDLFVDTYRVDLFSQVFKVMLSLGLLVVVLLCSELAGVDEKRHALVYLLLSLCTLAMMILVSAVNLITIYVALELSSYCLYVLVFLRKGQARSAQTAIRYFLVGASASAVMLFGLALIYGAARTTSVVELSVALPHLISRPDVLTGLLLVLGGFFFKLALFPFHFWAPDVYEGAANQVAAYIATASKVATVAVLIRVVAMAGDGSLLLVRALAALAIVSMTVGNLTAIVQKDFKRMLAYSTIAHGGYILLGILSMSPEGFAAAVFYALTVLVLKFSCFFVLAKVAADGANLSIDGLAGLHRRSPLLAMVLMMALFALAGIPPTIGFTGKLFIFTAAMAKGHLVLVLIAMFNVVVSLYYYLLAIKAAYLTEPAVDLPVIRLSVGERLLAGALVAVTVCVGIFPAPLLDLAEAAVRAVI